MFYFPTTIFCLLLVLLPHVSFAANGPKSLYSEDDPLWELNADNFNQTVFGKNNAWVIEFYSSWCGHCVRFAPTWKQFVRETKTWKRIVDVGVVNCVESRNVKLCRQYEVQSFPTIKMFCHNMNESDLGQTYEGPRDIPSIENGIIDFLESHWDEGVPSDWPSIRPLPMKTLHDITGAMHEAKQSIMLFIEYPDSYTGRKVILDLSFQINVIIRRILTTSERLMTDLNFVPSNSTVPTLIRIFRNNKQETLLGFSQTVNDTYIRDQIFEYLIGTSRTRTKDELATTEKPHAIEDADYVYLVDLENAVHYSLKQEVGVTKNIKGEKFSALKAYLLVLRNYFPGSPPLMLYISNLYNSLAYKTQSIEGEQFVQTMEQLQTKNEYLPMMKDWIGCKGSEEKYRGYPCSLWTLFHTLTVQANVKQDENTDHKSGEVLFVIRDYIKNFFTCQECAKNFLEMAVDVEKEVNCSKDAVLWLWKHHNQVNERLAGDVTEDPEHPKIQFPSQKVCPKCQEKSESGDISWNVDLVLQYLHKFYNRENILTVEHSGISSNAIRMNNSAMGIFLLSAQALLLPLFCHPQWYLQRF